MEWNGGTGVSPVRGDPLHSLDVRLSDRDRRGRLGFVGSGPPVGERGSRCSAGCFRARCIRRLFGNKLLCRYPAYNHKIHSAILRATLIAVVVGDRMIFGVSGCREPLGGESELCNQQSHQFGGAGSRELPIVAELRIVDRFVIGMPFDAHAVIAFGEQPGNPAEGTCDLDARGSGSRERGTKSPSGRHFRSDGPLHPERTPRPVVNLVAPASRRLSGGHPALR